MAGVRFSTPGSATNVGDTASDPLVNVPGGSLPRENTDAGLGAADNYFDTVDPDLDALYGSNTANQSAQSNGPVRFSNEGPSRPVSKGSYISNKPDFKKPLLSTQKSLGERLGSTTGKIQALGALRGDGEGKEQLRQEVRSEAKKALKDVAEKGVQKVTGKAVKNVAKQGAEKVAEQGAKLATKTTVRAVEGAVDVGTAGLGIIINIFVEIALQLGFDDAFDGIAALAKGEISEGRKLLIKAGMKVVIGLSVILVTILCMTVVGIIPALPAIIMLHVYWLLHFAFPGVSWFSGFLTWEIFLLLLVDIFVLIIFAVMAAALLYYACNVSGLNTSLGQAAASAASYVGISDLAGQLGSVCASFPK